MPYDVYLNILVDLAKDGDRDKIDYFLDHQALFVYETYFSQEPKLNDMLMINYRDYLYDDEIRDAKEKMAIGGNMPMDIDFFKEFYDELLPHSLKETKEFYDSFVKKHLAYLCALEIDRHRLTADIEGLKEFTKLFTDEKISNAIINVFKKLPSPALNGRSYEQWLEIKEDIAKTNKKFLIKDKNFVKSKYDNLIIKVDGYIWENPKVIDEFLKADPYKMSKEELTVIRNFKRFKTGIMVICDHRKDGTEILDLKEEKLYFVKGLFSTISDVIDSERLPILAQMTLLPFDDTITYSGYIQPMGIDVGNELAKMILDIKKRKKINVMM